MIFDENVADANYTSHEAAKKDPDFLHNLAKRHTPLPLEPAD
jgi:hypothetical protein